MNISSSITVWYVKVILYRYTSVSHFRTYPRDQEIANLLRICEYTEVILLYKVRPSEFRSVPTHNREPNVCVQPGLGLYPLLGTYFAILAFRNSLILMSLSSLGFWPFGSFKTSWLCPGQHISGCSRGTDRISPDDSTI